jgi:hypothetical protein
VWRIHVASWMRTPVHHRLMNGRFLRISCMVVSLCGRGYATHPRMGRCGECIDRACEREEKASKTTWPRSTTHLHVVCVYRRPKKREASTLPEPPSGMPIGRRRGIQQGDAMGRSAHYSLPDRNACGGPTNRRTAFDNTICTRDCEQEPEGQDWRMLTVLIFFQKFSG